MYTHTSEIQIPDSNIYTTTVIYLTWNLAVQNVLEGLYLHNEKVKYNRWFLSTQFPYLCWKFWIMNNSGSDDLYFERKDD